MLEARLRSVNPFANPPVSVPHALCVNYARVPVMDWKVFTFPPMARVRSISSKLKFSGEPMRKRGFNGQLMPIKTI